MINRTLIRTKLVQTLFAFYKNEGRTATSAEKDLLFSFQRTYDLYHYLLWLPVEVKRYAEQKIEVARNKRLPTPEDLNPNERFVQNRVINQLEQNTALQDYLEQNKLSWVNHSEYIQYLYNKICSREFFQLYMNANESTYQKDADLLRKVYERILAEDEFLQDIIEGDSLFWATDTNLVISFIMKTLRQFSENDGSDRILMPMFDDAQDAKMATKILRAAIENEADYRHWIDETITNWDSDRLAYMDTIIMQAALAEICTVPTIPVPVSVNEYMELAKEYSSPQSARFINGVLDTIVKRLQEQGKLRKAFTK